MAKSESSIPLHHTGPIFFSSTVPLTGLSTEDVDDTDWRVELYKKEMKKIGKVASLLDTTDRSIIYILESDSTSQTDNIQKVVKIVHTEINNGKREAILNSKLSHPNIMRYFGSFRLPRGEIGLVYERCIGSFTSLIEKVVFETWQLKRIAISLFHALQYLHSNNIVHLDVKPCNLFISSDEIVKLGDMGLSHKFANTYDRVVFTRGSPMYIAPEIVRKVSCHTEPDIWSAGICMYYLEHGVDFFDADDVNTLLLMVANYTYKPLGDSENAQLIEKCLVPIEKRPTADSLLISLCSS